MNLLSLSKVAFSYGDKCLFSDLNLTVSSSDFISIIGPNGSGKSTLLQLLNGLLKPSSGTVAFNNLSLARMSTRDIARNIAFVPQQTFVSHGFTALEIVLMGRFPYKSMAAMETDEDVAMAQQVLKTTGALHLADRRFDTLSGGEQQRVILASALVQQPAVLLLDEPTSALDLYYQLHIFKTLKMLNKSQKLTIISAVHDLNLAYRYSDKIWMLDSNARLITGTPDDILSPELLEPVFKVKMTVAEPFWLIPDNLIADGEL